jgi:hypothetical protein
MAIINDHPYLCKFWYPISASFAGAQASVVMKAPEINNTVEPGRNQVIARTKGGRNVVYDFGIKTDGKIELSFESVPDAERSAFLLFLEAVQYAKNVIAYQDHNGVVSYVRLSISSQVFKDVGYQIKSNTDSILWDFTLNLIDVTYNMADLNQLGAGLMATPLTLHLADFNDPHSPETTRVINIADGTITHDSEYVDSWDSVVWRVIVKKNTIKQEFFVSVTHDGYSTTDATAISTKIDSSNDINGFPSVVTLTADLNGAGTAQIIRLRAATSVDGYTIVSKKLKIGKLS